MREGIWIYCPVCHEKTRLKVNEDTVIKKLPLYCPKCKEVTMVSITNGQVILESNQSNQEPVVKTQSH